MYVIDDEWWVCERRGMEKAFWLYQIPQTTMVSPFLEVRLCRIGLCFRAGLPLMLNDCRKTTGRLLLIRHVTSHQVPYAPASGTIGCPPWPTSL